MTMTPELLKCLLDSGRKFTFSVEDGLKVGDETGPMTSKERRAERNKRYRERLNTSPTVLEPSHAVSPASQASSPSQTPPPSSLPLPPGKSC